MTSKQISALALKCLAIYLLFSAIIVLPATVLLARRAAGTYIQPTPMAAAGLTTIVVLSISAITGGLGILAWRLANSLANAIGSPPVDNINVHVTPRQLEEILLRVLGVFFVIDYLKPFVNELVRRQLLSGAGYRTSETSWSLVTTLAVILFGAFLIAKAGRFADVLDKLTRKSISPTTPPTVE